MADEARSRDSPRKGSPHRGGKRKTQEKSRKKKVGEVKGGNRCGLRSLQKKRGMRKRTTFPGGEGWKTQQKPKIMNEIGATANKEKGRGKKSFWENGLVSFRHRKGKKKVRNVTT